MGGKKSLAVGILQIPITRFSESFFKVSLRVGNQVTRSFNSANIGLFNEPFLELSDLFELLQNVSNCSHWMQTTPQSHRQDSVGLRN